MSNKHGDWIWYELMTTDAAAATTFYGPLLGWSVGPAMDVGGGADYRQITAPDGDHAGGILALTPEMVAGGARTGWIGYVAVDDVDAAVTTLTTAGGGVVMPAKDLPGVGRFALVADPEGVPFYVMRGSVEGHASRAFAADGPHPGHCAWNELSAIDQRRALAFYGTVFGWIQDGGMDMGPLGTYAFLRHGSVIGAIMPKPEHRPAPGWTFYFRVPDIDAAAAHIGANGGQVFHGPVEVPGGDWIVNAVDPQGGAFALVGRRA
ncbi:VOC family protein [Siculibacillus lacustris]|uniref:VOC family protein n=1 Tax=Siculibacillus lacustris TaxID=1549641 RepID=A0A4Q9VZ59_9HYPH|nr:VOC family protein [Siculibacillus lacustris]TBW40909.1 VOC family protein [Siculibacillus lacustris]